MTSIVVDKDVVSFLSKNDTRVQLYLPHLQGRILALSFMTVAELYQWAYARGWADRRLAELEARLRRHVIVPFDNDLCKHWASICVQRRRMGKPISVQDAWIAATALRHSCPLVTHNGADFEDIPNLTVISEVS